MGWGVLDNLFGGGEKIYVSMATAHMFVDASGNIVNPEEGVLGDAVLKATLTDGNYPYHLVAASASSISNKVKSYFRYAENDEYIFGFPEGGTSHIDTLIEKVEADILNQPDYPLPTGNFFGDPFYEITQIIVGFPPEILAIEIDAQETFLDDFVAATELNSFSIINQDYNIYDELNDVYYTGSDGQYFYDNYTIINEVIQYTLIFTYTVPEVPATYVQTEIMVLLQYIDINTDPEMEADFQWQSFNPPQFLTQEQIDDANNTNPGTHPVDSYTGTNTFTDSSVELTPLVPEFDLYQYIFGTANKLASDALTFNITWTAFNGEYGVIKREVYQYTYGDSSILPLTNTYILNLQDNFTDEFYLPIAVLRKDFVDVNDDVNSAWFTSTEGLLNTLKFNLVDLVDSYTTDNQAEYLRDAFLYFGVNLFTDSQADLQYLYKYFDHINELKLKGSLGTNPIYQEDLDDPFIINVVDNHYIYTIIEEDFNITLSFSSIVITENIIGTFKEGAATGDYGSEVTYSTSSLVEPFFSQFSLLVLSENNGGILTIFHQTSINTYSKIEIHDYLQTSTIKKGGRRSNIRLRLDNDEENQKQMNIPILLSVLEDMTSNALKSELLYNSGKLVFYAEQRVYVSWYETGFFAFVVFILVIWWTWDPNAASFISALIAGQSAAWITLGTALLVGYIAAEALKYIGKEFGSDVAILAAIAMAVLAPQALGKSMLLVDQLLLGVGLIVTTQLHQLQRDFDALHDEKALFDDQLKTANEKLDDAVDLLEGDVTDSLLNIIAITINPFVNEKPDSFISRKLTTNFADQIFSSTHTFVEDKLKLPELVDTIPMRNDIIDGTIN